MTTQLKFNPFDVNSAQNDINRYEYVQKRKDFLNSFGSNHIYCYNNNPRVKLSGMNHTSDINDVLSQNISNNADAYFYVNGCRKKDDIKTVRSCYIDLDAGRDENGQYFAPRIVMEKKKEFLNLIHNFPVKPTWVLDTRNGYQVYWVIAEKDYALNLVFNKKYWNGIQKKLANYFNADIRAMKINQIFRLPYTWWRKPWEGKKSYFSTLLDCSTGQKVSMIQLQEALSGQSAQIHVQSAKSSDAWYENIRKSVDTNSENSVPIPTETAKTILNKLIRQDNTNPIIIGEEDEIPDYDNEDTNTICNTFVASEKQLKLLSSVVDFLNQVATPLFFSNNKFLSSSARELAAKVSDEFCVG
jgi:hypothetical protein